MKIYFVDFLNFTQNVDSAWLFLDGRTQAKAQAILLSEGKYVSLPKDELVKTRLVSTVVWVTCIICVSLYLSINNKSFYNKTIFTEIVNCFYLYTNFNTFKLS